MNKAWVVLLLSCAGTVQAAEMAVVRYLDQEPGEPAYTTRILVTPEFLRMDGGADAGDFVLLDRHQRRVINVMHGNRMAMVFVPGRLPERPANWKARLTTQPGTAGTRRYTLTVNGRVCSAGVAARDAAPDVARALAELKSVLAATQYRVWKDTPRELQHDCDLANQVWEAGTSLELGLLLEERDFSGRSRQFESESKEPLRPELFRLPEGYAAIDAPS